MGYLYVSKYYDPFKNLAKEELLCHIAAAHDMPLLYLWRNELCAVVGINQNPWDECDIKALDLAGALLVRRKSGGGTVFHDMGNLNFSFCMPKGQYDENKQYSIILKALERLGIQAERSGRNDIIVGNQKISGNAFFHDSKFSLHHGTLLIESDITVFSKYLTPGTDKLVAKGVKSVASRVGTLQNYQPNLSVEQTTESLIKVFQEEYGEIIKTPTIDDEQLNTLSLAYASWDFRFGRTPPFESRLENRFDFGKISLNFYFLKGRIAECRCYSDSLDIMLPKKLEECLKGVLYKKQEMADAVKKCVASNVGFLISTWLLNADI